MKYENVKSGLSTLFTAELLTIVGSFSGTFNGEGKTAVALLLSLVTAAAFVLNLVGLKKCAKDKPDYNKPFNLTIAALVLCMGLTVLSVAVKDLAFARYANEIQSFMGYLVAFSVLKTTAPILKECGREAEATYADRTRQLYTAGIVLSVTFGALADNISGSTSVSSALVCGIMAVVILLVAEVRYIISLKKSSNAL